MTPCPTAGAFIAVEMPHRRARAVRMRSGLMMSSAQHDDFEFGDAFDYDR